jgi:hypothetical protein
LIARGLFIFAFKVESMRFKTQNPLSLSFSLCCGLLLLCAPATAQTSEVSTAARALIQEALTARGAGDTTQALRLLTDLTFTARASDAAAAKLRLSYVHYGAKNREQAKVYFRELTEMPPAINDTARGEAALRLAYLSNGEERTRLAERIVAGEFDVSREHLTEAYHLAAAQAHGNHDLVRAMELYSESPAMEPVASARPYALKELAGLCLRVTVGVL